MLGAPGQPGLYLLAAHDVFTAQPLHIYLYVYIYVYIHIYMYIYIYILTIPPFFRQDVHDAGRARAAGALPAGGGGRLQGGRQRQPLRRRRQVFFFFTLVTGPTRSLSLKMSDATAYEPQIRARLGTTAHHTL